MNVKKPPSVPPCRDGWNYHVFCLGADRCSCCGWNRYAKKTSS